MKTWTHFLKRVFTPAECAEINAAMADVPVRDGTVVTPGKDVVMTDVRRAKVRWVPMEEPLFYPLIRRLELLGARVNGDVFGFDIVPQIRAMQHTEYHAADEGCHNWHEDNNWLAQGHDRKLTAVLLLTPPEEFAGGTFELAHEKLNNFSQGDVVFIPAFHKHRVTPVTAGVRKTLVSWWYGPPWR